jgi:hypothetical protein
MHGIEQATFARMAASGASVLALSAFRRDHRRLSIYRLLNVNPDCSDKCADVYCYSNLRLPQAVGIEARATTDFPGEKWPAYCITAKGGAFSAPTPMSWSDYFLTYALA